MWDKKIFKNIHLNFIIYNMYSLYPHELLFNFFSYELIIKISNIFLIILN